MSIFSVKGGTRLKGVYRVSGAKNAAPKLLLASLLTKERCVFENIPNFSDTQQMVTALQHVGVRMRSLTPHTIEAQGETIVRTRIPAAAARARQSVLFIGAMLARAGRVTLSLPRGDAIGRRPLNRHFEGIKALGGTLRHTGRTLALTLPARPRAMRYRFEKNTHTGTENLILASVFNEGTVILQNAAQEPEVDNLIETLNRMGARIRRTAPRTIAIAGVPPLLNGARASAIPDRLEAATAITASILTGGGITVARAPRRLLVPFARFCTRIGVRLRWKGDTVAVSPFRLPLKPARLSTGPHPGFMTDWQPLATLIVATLARGKSTIHERVFETRWRYLQELHNMGVRSDTFQPKGWTPKDYNFNDEDYSAREPHAAAVWGPTRLTATELHSHDVRAGMDMLLAALSAKGTSVIRDPHGHIERGYEDIVGKLKRLGADITRR